MMAQLDDEYESLLQLAAAGDNRRLAAFRARVAGGEAAPYVAGLLRFRERVFKMDTRAYITDPEASFFVDAVNAQGQTLAAQSSKPIHLLEFGVGAGTLGISIKLDHPDWTLSGLDVDAAALTLAQENALAHGVDLELLVSDYLDGWPVGRSPPDLLFGDPPWGDGDDLYDAARDESYYRQMPVLSAFPSGGRTSIHDELIRRFAALRWPTMLMLNYGILPIELIERSAAPLAQWRLIHPRPELSVLLGHAQAT